MVDVQGITDAYRKYAAVPGVVSASLTPITDQCCRYTLTSVWSQRNIERTESTKFMQNYLVELNDPPASTTPLTPVGPVVEICNETLSSCTEDGRKRAVIKKVKPKKGDEDKFFLEIWMDGHRSENVDLLSLNKHGKVWEDMIFGCLQWSKNAEMILFIAEKKRPKPMSYFSEKSEDSDDVDLGGEYLYREDWGELLVGRHQPVLCVYNCVNKQLTVLDDTVIPTGISPGQAVWGPDDKGIVFAGFFHDNLRLGLIYCFNRRSAIFHVNLAENTCEMISPTDQQSVRLPRLSPDGKKLIYFSNSVGGAHMQCCQLIMYDWQDKTTRIVVDISQQDRNALFEDVSVFGSKTYHGLYVDSVPQRVWMTDSRTVVIPSLSEVSKVCVVVDTDTGEIGSVTGPCSALDVYNDYIVTVCHQFNSRDKLHIIHRTELSQSHDLVFDRPVKISSSFEKHETTGDPTHGNLNYYSILLEPEVGERNLNSLILWPHGGPHTASVQQFNVYFAALCDLGFSLLFVNYRGSLGAGQDSVDSLTGNISEYDVDDCHNAVLYHINKQSNKWSKVFLCGGSHGGFLVCHLMAKHPDFYKACVSRNPVCNLAAMYTCTDIPQWCYAEAGLMEFTCGRPIGSKTQEHLYNLSPITHVHKVKTPTLLMLGTDDRRVPPSQGKEFYNALKCNNVETKLLIYPENSHPLSKIDAEADVFVNMVRWFLRFNV